MCRSVGLGVRVGRVRSMGLGGWDVLGPWGWA